MGSYVESQQDYELEIAFQQQFSSITVL